MSNFLWDTLATIATKSDSFPLAAGADATKFIAASDINAIVGYITDIRTVLGGFNPTKLLGNAPATGGVAVAIDNQTAQTTGNILSIRTGGVERIGVGFAGTLTWSNGQSYVQGAVTDGPTAVANVVDSVNTLNNAAAKLFSIRSGGVEKAWVDFSGGLYAGPSGTGFIRGAVLSPLSGGVSVRGNITDGSGAIAAKVTNSVALTVTGAKILVLYSDDGVTQRAYINKDGVYVGPDAFGRVTVADTAYTSLITDNLIVYTSITAARIVTLTHPQDIGHVIVVKDESGSVTGTFTITITDSGGSGNMQGGANQVINSAFGTVRLYWSGAKWFVW